MFPAFFRLGTARRIAAKPHDESGYTIIICQWDIEMFCIEIFATLQMNASQEAQGLATLQYQIAALLPSRHQFRRHAFLEGLSRDMAGDFGKGRANETEHV